MPPRRPLPPFENWPVQLCEEGFGFAWYVEPAGFVLQATALHGSVPFVVRFNDLIDHVLEARKDSVEREGGLFIFHDWRAVTGYDREARTCAIERMRARRKGYARRTIVAVSPKSRLLRMAVEAVNLFAVVTLHSKVELMTDPTQTLATSRLTPPAAGSLFP